MEENLITNQEYFQQLTNEKEKKIFNDYLEYITNCPKCNTSDYVTYISRGRPTNDLCEVASKVKTIKLGGCCRNGQDLNEHCRKCGTDF